MNVKTRNWGPEFKQLSNLIGLKSHAGAQHTTNLQAEVARHDGTHGYGRHGAQTGWEAQMIRACTKITPDQVFDPMGLNPTIRRWGGIFSMSDADGSRELDLFDQHGNPPVDYRTAAGKIAGGFLTPEAQFLAKARGDAVVAGLSGAKFFAAQYAFKGGPNMIRAPFSAVKVSVMSPNPGAPYGLGFSRRDGAGGAFTHDFVSACIDGFMTRKTWAQIEPAPTAATHKFHMVTLGRNKIAFAEMTDLFEYFDLDVLWQKSATLIYRRDYNAAARAHGAWRLITMFPDSGDAGWAPSLWLSDSMKAAITAYNVGKPSAKKINKNAKDYTWTGVVSAAAGQPQQRFPVPAWA